MLNLFRDCVQFLDIYTGLIVGRPAKAPLAVYLELTKRCNYKCGICDLWKLESQDEFTLDQLKSFIAQCNEAGVKLLHVEGGEATLLPFFPEFVEEAVKKKIHLSLTTNGSTLTPSYADRLVDAGLKTVAISIDSHIAGIHDASRGVKGAFNRTVSSIRDIRKRHPDLKLWINHIVHRRNLDKLRDFVDFCITLDIDTIYFLPIHNLYPIKYFDTPDNDLYFKRPEETELLRKAMDDAVIYMKEKRINTLSDTFYRFVPESFTDSLPAGYCDEGQLVCEIDSAGDVYLCLPGRQKIGNVKRGRLAEIWRSKEAERLRKDLKGCGHCWYNCHIEPKIRFKAGYFLLNPLKMLRDYRMHLG